MSFVENLKECTNEILKIFFWITKEVSQYQVENYEQKKIHLKNSSFRLTTLSRFLTRL